MGKTLGRAILAAGLVVACGSDGRPGNPEGAGPSPDAPPVPVPLPTAIPAWPDGFSIPAPGAVQNLRLASTGAEIALAWQKEESISLARVRPAAGSEVEVLSAPAIGAATECETPDDAETSVPGDPRFLDPWIAVADGRFTLAFTLSWSPYFAARLLRLPLAIDGRPGCSEALWEDAAIGQCRSVRSGPAGLAPVGASLAVPYVLSQGCAGQLRLEFGSGMTLPPQGSASPWPGIPDLPPPDPVSSLDLLQASHMAIGGDGTSALAIGVSPNLYPSILVTENDATLVDLSDLAPEPLDLGGDVPHGTGPNAIAITALGDDFLVVWSDRRTTMDDRGTEILASRVDRQGRPLAVRPDLRVRRLGRGSSGSEVNLQAASQGNIALVTWTTDQTPPTERPQATAVFVAGEISSRPLSLEELFALEPGAFAPPEAVAITAHEDGFALAAEQPAIEVRILSGDELPPLSEFPSTPTCRVLRFESCETSADCCADQSCSVTPSGFGPYCL